MVRNVSSPAAADAAPASAANPEAELASPAAVGTVFTDATCAAPRIPARSRTMSRNAVMRSNARPVTGAPSRVA